jgi:hypothetical protein
VKSVALWQMIFISVLAAACGQLLFGPPGAAIAFIAALLIGGFGDRRPHVLK